jgi:D-alanyl-D-alanine carboxypeptidase-like protein
MLRLLAIPLALVALHQVDSSIRPLSEPLRSNLEHGQWRPGCPVALTHLRVVTVPYVDFDGRTREGQIIVNRDVAGSVSQVFKKLYKLKFPIRHMRLADMYGPPRAIPDDEDVTGSFWCRDSVPSPCVGGTASGSWSNHAYGHAIDINPIENPYIGCGKVFDPRMRPYVDRSRRKKGMVTPAVVRAFRAIGWGWGGDWSSGTKDYMHFSTNGH